MNILQEEMIKEQVPIMDSQQTSSKSKNGLKGFLLLFLTVFITICAFTKKGFLNSQKPFIKRGDVFTDNETGEELIVTKKGGRKKKAQLKETAETSTSPTD